MIHLSNRLTNIKNLTPKGIVIDVGADHGQLIISLIREGVAPYGYAVENKKGPYDILVSAVKREGLENKIACLLADGLSKSPKEVDIVVIAGMGGLNIIDILKRGEKALKNVKYIIVDPHSAIADVRRYVSSIGFMVDEEVMVLEDDVYYELIRFKRGEETYSEDDYTLGPILRKRKDKTYLAKWKKRLDEIDFIINKDVPDNRKKELLEEKERILKNYED